MKAGFFLFGFVSRLFTLCAILFFPNSEAQVFKGEELNPDKPFENVFVKKLYSDSLSTSFVIWIKQDVKPHKHDFHTEHVQVLEGSGDMMLGNKSIKIKEGSIIIIPEGVVHSVKTTSQIPLKVLSIQSPEFHGKDRIWINEEEENDK